MDNTRRYWKFIRLDAAGGCKAYLVADVQAFFQQQFPNSAAAVVPSDLAIQRQLIQLVQSNAPLQDRRFAEASLRCFISHCVQQTCFNLAKQFQEAGFSQADLLPLVLNDIDITQPLTLSESASPYQPLAAKILQTFNPDRSSLGTWTARLVEQNKTLNALLVEHGIYLISDWALLNAASAKSIQRRLASSLTQLEVQTFCVLLKAYHGVYRRDRRLDQKQSGQRCDAPTPYQLQQIGDCLWERNLLYSARQVLEELRLLAKLLRQAQRPTTQPLDERQVDQKALASPDTEDVLLNTYFQEFSECLDGAIALSVREHWVYHSKKKPPTDEKFLKALYLFYCECQSMNEIAKAIGLQQQYHVTRLLRLKELQASVQRTTIELMQHHPFLCSQIGEYVNLTRLVSLDEALVEALDKMVAEAKAEASTPKRSSDTLFSSRLCRYLKQCLSVT